MAKVIKLNSGKGLVTFSNEDLVEYNLIRYIRSSFKGIGKSGLLTDHPFETVAASLFKEENPSDQIKIAEKCLLRYDKEGKHSVDVVLRISEDTSDGMYAKHPTEVTFKKQEKKRQSE